MKTISIDNYAAALARKERGKWPPAVLLLLKLILLVVGLMTNAPVALAAFSMLVAAGVFAGVLAEKEWAYWASFVAFIAITVVSLPRMSPIQLLILLPFIWYAAQGVRGVRAARRIASHWYAKSHPAAMPRRPGILKQRNRGTALVYRLVALVLWASSLTILARRLIWVGSRGSVWDYLIDFGAFAISALGFWCLGRARRHAVLGVGRLRVADPRPPVVLLRSFQDDLVKIWRAVKIPFPGSPADIGFEEHLTSLLCRFGPVVAIGRPGEPLPPSGAAREYLAHDEWQGRIHEWLDQASLTLMIVGRSAGVVWELEQLIERDHLAKSILLLPPLSDHEIRLRWQLLHSRLGLPDDSPAEKALVLAFPRNAEAILLTSDGRRKKDRHYWAAVELAALRLAATGNPASR